MASPKQSLIMKGHCPDCGPNRNAKILASYKDAFNDDDSGVWGSTDWRISQCGGCNRIYVQKRSVFSEDIDHYADESGAWQERLRETFEHWPSPRRKEEPVWLMKLAEDYEQIASLLEDVYGCINGNLSIPAAIAMRTVFDKAAEDLGIDEKLTFSGKLDSLEKLNLISGHEKVALNTLVEAGSAAVHRGWRPKWTDIDVMVSITESFINRVFIIHQAATKLGGDIPPR